MLNKTYFYLFLLVCLAIGAYLLAPFRDVIFLSFIVVNLFYPVFRFFQVKLKMNRHVATLFSILIVIITFLIPVIIFINITIGQVNVFYKDVSDLVSGNNLPQAGNNMIVQINHFLERIPYNTYRISSSEILKIAQENFTTFGRFLLDNSINIGSKIFTIFPLTIIFAFILWSSFADYQQFLNFLKKISPLSDELDELYFRRVTAMTNAMVRGTFVVAIVQGMAGGLVLWIAGVPYVFFFTILMILLSIIPLGAGFVTIPVGIALILSGNVPAGIFVLVMQLVVVGNLDNVLRPRIVSKDAEIHPILLLLSILGGVQIFGFFGIVYGPLIMIVILTTLEIYMKYYRIKGVPLKVA